MKHWADKYVGRQYVSRAYDCASLVVEVLRNEFNKDVPDYGERPPLRSEQHELLVERIERRTRRIETPHEGCAVQILIDGRIQHIGVYCEVNGFPSVLHNILKHGAIITPIHEMRRQGMVLEGYYEWI